MYQIVLIIGCSVKYHIVEDTLQQHSRGLISSEQHTFYCTMYIAHFTSYIVHFTSYIVHYTTYIMHCALHCTLHIELNKLYNIHYTLHSAPVNRKTTIVHSILDGKLYTIQYYSIQHTIYITPCALYIPLLSNNTKLVHVSNLHYHKYSNIILITQGIARFSSDQISRSKLPFIENGFYKIPTL